MAEAKSFRDELIEKVLLKMVQTHDAAASNVIKFYPNGRLGKCITLIVLSDENLDLDNWKVIEIPDKNDINPLECHMDLKIHNVIDYFEWNWIKDESKILLSYTDVDSDGWDNFIDIDDSKCNRYQLVYKCEMDVSKLSSTLLANKLNSEEIRKEVRALIQSRIDQIMNEDNANVFSHTTSKIVNGGNKNDEV